MGGSVTLGVDRPATRLGIGKRALEKGQVEIARRDTREKSFVEINGVASYVVDLLETIQSDLFNRAVKFREEHTSEVENFDDFKSVVEEKGGFVSAHWDGTTETELKIKELTKATIRCIPNEGELSSGKCVLTGKPSERKVLFAKAY